MKKKNILGARNALFLVALAVLLCPNMAFAGPSNSSNYSVGDFIQSSAGGIANSSSYSFRFTQHYQQPVASGSNVNLYCDLRWLSSTHYTAPVSHTVSGVGVCFDQLTVSVFLENNGGSIKLVNLTYWVTDSGGNAISEVSVQPVSVMPGSSSFTLYRNIVNNYSGEMQYHVKLDYYGFAGSDIFADADTRDDSCGKTAQLGGGLAPAAIGIDGTGIRKVITEVAAFPPVVWVILVILVIVIAVYLLRKRKEG